jgi:serine/threonine protein kinase
LRLTKSNQIFEVRELEIWVKDLCAALEYAHKDVGTIHGDIRPNYLIVGPAGSIKVKDFGIANCIAESMGQLTEFQRRVRRCHTRARSGELGELLQSLTISIQFIYESLTSKPPLSAGNIGVEPSEKILTPMAQQRAKLGIKGAPIPTAWLKNRIRRRRFRS